MVVIHQVLKKLYTLLCLDLIRLNQVVGGCDLQVLSLLFQVLSDLAGSKLAPDHTGLFGLFLLGPLKLLVAVLIVPPSTVKGSPLVSFGSLQLTLENVFRWEEDDVGQVLHLKI